MLLCSDGDYLYAGLTEKWPFQCFVYTCIKYYCACLLIRKQNWGNMIRSISIFHSQVLYLLHPPTLCLLVFCWNCFGISPRYLCICIFIRSFSLPLKSTLHKVQGQSEITVQAKNLNPSQVRLLLQTTRLLITEASPICWCNSHQAGV